MTDSDAVIVRLSRNEAMVLDAFLSRTSAANSLEPFVEDQAELRVLWDVEAMLEKALADDLVNNPHYDARLAAARDAIRDVKIDWG